MKRTALALSPHLDDAIFSCGGTLHRLARNGWRVLIATAFTRSVPDPSGFALACQLDKGLGADVDYMALRRAEDRVACLKIGCIPPLHLDLPEAPHRGYESATALFEAPHASDDISALLIDAFVDTISREGPDLILAPQAIGAHVDHVETVRALQRVGVTLPILWWQDFPYVTKGKDRRTEPFGPHFRAMASHDIGLAEEDRSAKVAGSAAYASQIAFQFGSLEGLYEKQAAVTAELFAVQNKGALDMTLEM